MSSDPRQPMNRQSPAQQDHEMQDMQPEVGRPMKVDSFADTVQWSRFVKSGSSLESLPAIPSQCLLPSDDDSRASSSQPGNMRPFAGLGLNTLSHIPRASSSGFMGQLLPGNERRMQLYEDSAGKQYLQSLTELATPSLQLSQDLDVGAAIGNNIAKVQNALQRISEERSQDSGTGKEHSKTISQGIQTREAHHEEIDEKFLPRIRSIIADYPIKIQNYEHRLDALENASFSHSFNDGDLDNRVEDLETRVDELEKARQAQSEAGSFAGRRHLEESIDSRMSNTSSALIAAAIDGIDYGRIEALETQISELQSVAHPSHARPWEFEVVFLPYGSRLNGIWSSRHPPSQKSRMNSTSGEETQTQHNSVAAALATHDESVSWQFAMKQFGDEQDAWLMPRVCGLRSRIAERLRSRGLVKRLQITGPDAGDFQAAMLAAFGDLTRMLANDPYSHHSRTRQNVPGPLSMYHGLNNSWVPLRKLHKDDNLRFLNTTEMVTPALWSPHFLSSSVATRLRGTRRLYVTQSDGYVQNLGARSAEWTWQKLRQLPRVYPDVPSIGHTPEADAHEPCWEFDAQLDPPPSIHSSFASHHSSLSIRPSRQEQEAEPSSPSDHFSSQAASPMLSTTPTSLAPPPAQPPSPLKERHPFRPLHTRTVSMPSLVPIKSSPSMPKRRITSFDNEIEHDSHSSPVRTLPAPLKRRRTRSPSRLRDTPRYSVEPPSPFTFADDMVERNKRGTTPFAYATPHSNAPYIEAPRNFRGDSDEEGSATDEVDVDEGYDRHALSDYDSDEGSDVPHQPDEDVWEGVQDDESKNALGKTTGLRHGDDDDDDDMASEASSSPSEYPSRQPEAFYSETKAGFRIHVDEEVQDGH
ncbi:hypothetical protein D0Z07_1180 [Hyphodiscus hymeniophilus]|uniref:Uncharacterized protein n=1 Tax=Hyphodiscus hymeniophilus TaxID=353542 RepID=A0A9P6VPR5_9HELO|nr:hypothetical protein D0Z07_1180 [Hyphodiscus hymeniophilus]